MGIGLPIAACVAAQGGSSDPKARINQRNLDIIADFASRLEQYDALKKEVFFGEERVQKYCFAEEIFESDTVDFKKFKYLKEKYRYLTFVLPTEANLSIITKHSYLPHISHILGSSDHPILIAKFWIDVIRSSESENRKFSILRNHAINLKTRLIKTVEQDNHRDRYLK